jgi:hypothetical protein
MVDRARGCVLFIVACAFVCPFALTAVPARATLSPPASAEMCLGLAQPANDSAAPFAGGTFTPASGTIVTSGNVNGTSMNFSAAGATIPPDDPVDWSSDASNSNFGLGIFNALGSPVVFDEGAGEDGPPPWSEDVGALPQGTYRWVVFWANQSILPNPDPIGIGGDPVIGYCTVYYSPPQTFTIVPPKLTAAAIRPRWAEVVETILGVSQKCRRLTAWKMKCSLRWWWPNALDNGLGAEFQGTGVMTSVLQKYYGTQTAAWSYTISGTRVARGHRTEFRRHGTADPSAESGFS